MKFITTVVFIVLTFSFCLYMSILTSPDYSRRGHACLVGTSFGYIEHEDKENWFNKPDYKKITVRYVDKNNEWHIDSFPYQIVKDLTIINIDEFLKQQKEEAK